MKTILFCRVSSKEQEETGYSLDAQEKLLKEYAEKKKLSVEKVYKISESASGKQVRKLFNDMFIYTDKHKIEVICCEKIDRLTRNLKDASLVQDWINGGQTREVHFLKESFVLNRNTKAHESLVWDMKVAIARFYTNNLSEEVKKGQKEKISQGWLPTRPPLGYITIGEKGHKTHKIDTDKAHYIQKMFELYSTGNYSTKALVEVMYKDGLRSREGKKIGKSRMYDLLTDPFYYGKIRWKGEVSQGVQEPIITKELFDQVQEKLNRKFKSPQYKKHFPVFKAKIDCDECHGTVTWELQKGHWYGHCNHYKTCAQNKWWRQEKLEEVLFPLFDKVAPASPNVLKVLEKALKESHSSEIDYRQKSVDEINKEIDTNQRRLEAIYEDKIDHKISPEFYSRKFNEYTKNKEDALNELKKIEDGNTKYYEAGFAIHELASKASEIYKSPNATTEDKRLLLSKVFSNLSLKQDNIGHSYTMAFEFLVKWVPLLNETFEPKKPFVYNTKGFFDTKSSTLLPR
jgi:site-specific DNA recombinase